MTEDVVPQFGLEFGPKRFSKFGRNPTRLISKGGVSLLAKFCFP